jgi:hypothetical protein
MSSETGQIMCSLLSHGKYFGLTRPKYKLEVTREVLSIRKASSNISFQGMTMAALWNSEWNLINRYIS